MEYDRVYHCEQASTGRDADRENEDRGDREAAMAPETASRIPEVLYESGERHAQKHRRFSPKRSTSRIGDIEVRSLERVVGPANAIPAPRVRVHRHAMQTIVLSLAVMAVEHFDEQPVVGCI